MKLINKDKFTKAPAAVLIDLDNTLYPYQPAHEAGMKASAAKLMSQLNLDESTFSEQFAVARDQVKIRLGTVAASHHRLLYFHQLFENMGLKSQPLLALDLNQTYWQNFMENIALHDGVEDFLDALRLRDIPTALVTDLTTATQFRKLVYLNLDQSFDYIVTSEEAGADKPDPAPFNLALEKLGLDTDSPQVWMIGDNPKPDMMGAKNAIGATTLLFTESNKAQPDAQADLVFSSYHKLADLINQI